MKPSEKLYHKYEYLARNYANRIFSYEELSFEFEDLVQEFKMKIFTSIKAYGRRWSRYRKGEDAKPVPLKFYLQAACGNKMRDFIKYINRENYKTRIDDINMDFGITNETQIKPEENKFMVNGIDLLEGLSGKEKIVFSMYLRGYKTKILTKVYYNTKEERSNRNEIKNGGDEPLTVNDVIQMQCNYLISNYGSDLRRESEIFTTYNFED